ncbi:DUF4145 domain-containing protein [Gluconobacter cerinus]|uniref:DUF4145 domain-containing protein n=1 Tax=Gluconobacter cerinus TaxID=38307 RepID=UPI001B8BEED8|nr:DUF4145 domain-containing protein [Gluconobacter cerinus]MBS1067276.1 DUF4145 domain-containing protein [Gluconobacter cerinus]
MTFDCVGVHDSGMDPTHPTWNRYSVFGTCRGCFGGIVIDATDCNPSEGFMIYEREGLTDLRNFPDAGQKTVSHYMPRDVRQAMIDAEETLIGAPARVARGQFRIVLDVATKYVLEKNPECVADRVATHPLKLNDRINVLAKHHLLTPALRDWAHGVRGITNDDVHGIEPVTSEEAQEIAEITRMILIYLFEMPARVLTAQDASKAKKAAAEA